MFNAGIQCGALISAEWVVRTLPSTFLIETGGVSLKQTMTYIDLMVK